MARRAASAGRALAASASAATTPWTQPPSPSRAPRLPVLGKRRRRPRRRGRGPRAWAPPALPARCLPRQQGQERLLSRLRTEPPRWARWQRRQGVWRWRRAASPASTARRRRCSSSRGRAGARRRAASQTSRRAGCCCSRLLLRCAPALLTMLRCLKLQASDSTFCSKCSLMISLSVPSAPCRSCWTCTAPTCGPPPPTASPLGATRP